MADNTRGPTARQEQWFASVVEGLAKETGKSLDEWADLVRRTCPESTHAKRLAWLNETHGLGVNRASAIVDAAFGTLGWDRPDDLAAALWTTSDQWAILEAVRATLADWPGATETQRKGFTAFSRRVQFAALAPIKGGGARLGLAVLADEALLLEPPRKRESWSERLRSVLVVETAAGVDALARHLLKAAYDVS
jgi:Domain of unknown function (DUF4287)/Domain of unknown function (DUF5655)